MQCFIRQSQGSCYSRACESPLTQRPGPPTPSQPYVHHRLPSSAEKAFNKYTREAVHQVDRALPVLSMEKKIMIHDSQLCFNSNRRLVLGKGQAAWWWAGGAVGRSGDKATSVCNTRPREGERWVTPAGPDVQKHTETH